MRIRIRDFFETLDVCKETFHPNEDWKEMEACILILDGMGLIGIVYYKPYKEKKELGIVIRKEYWGQGRGEKAIRGISELAKGNGITELIAKVFTKNRPMIHLMDKLGWECYEEKLDFKLFKKTL